MHDITYSQAVDVSQPLDQHVGHSPPAPLAAGSFPLPLPSPALLHATCNRVARRRQSRAQYPPAATRHRGVHHRVEETQYSL